MKDSAPGTAKSQDVYGLVRTAIENRRPIAAVYHKRHRLFCPHRLGRNKQGQHRVLCYQYGGESESGMKAPGSSDNWRCIDLSQLSKVELLNGPWQTAANHSRPASCIADAEADAEDYVRHYDGR
jgi:hypothetical protein